MSFLSVKVTGLKPAIAKLAYVEPELMETIEETFEEIGNFIVKRSRMNAPIRTGELRKKIEAKTKKRPMKLVIEDDVSYALRMHEEPFQLGPLSRKMNRATKEGGIGNKYIERPIRTHQDFLTKKMQEIPEKFTKKLNKKEKK